MKLTDAQREAVATTGKNLCVSAGAGTGKTHVLVERFLYLVENKLARPAEILAITFTEKAANEMKSRIAEALRARHFEEARRELESAYIGTIHSFCSRILKEHPLEAGVDPDFRVLREDETYLLQEAVLDELMESHFQEPDIFQLLRIYSESSVREGIGHVHSKMQTFGRAQGDFSIFHRNTTTDTEALKQKTLDALKSLKKIDGKEADISELKEALSAPVKNWQAIEAAREIGRRFRRHKSREDISILRDSLDAWAASWAETLSEPFRQAFVKLTLEFERRFYETKRAKSVLDFNDLEREAHRLVSGSAANQRAILNLYRNKFKFIMVDEFQDTSPIQDELITFLSRGDNLFIVGDWKQSIYGFRGAELSLFSEKERIFQEPGAGRWISISENFRSRSEVLEFINPFFERLWTEEKRPFQSLEAGLRFPDKKIPSAELMTIESEVGEKAGELRIKEARVLARRIQELVQTGEFRYRDFAMLFRAGTDIHLYEYELRNLNIPYYLVSGSGFYRQSEIRDLMSALEFLENPHLDIPLAALLRSPLVQISDDALFHLAQGSKRIDPNAPFYGAVLKFKELSQITEKDSEKLRAFNEIFGRLLAEKEKWSISECLERILEQTGYHLYVLGLPQGQRCFANIRKLLEMAREIEGREPVHLGDFVRYIKGLETQEVRESEAQVEAEEGDVVKLLTIHKAKGLEYKVVILPDLNRKLRSKHPKFLIDSEIGFGMKAWNDEAHEFEYTPAFGAVREKTDAQSYEESKRLFYVAMTRAQEHLIFSGSSKPISEEDGDHEEGGKRSTWYDWVSDFASSFTGPLARTVITEIPHAPKKRPSALIERKKIRESLLSGKPIRIKTPQRTEEILESLTPVTPLRFDRIDLPVSAYAAFEQDPEEYARIYEHGVLREEGEKIEEWDPDEDETAIHAADFGTVIHAIFEHLVSRPDHAGEKLSGLLQSFAGDLDGNVQKEIQELSRQFLKSKTFSEIKGAKNRFPEIPFVLRLKSGMIQGTLDLLYQTQEGQWVILDYKTSRLEGTSLEALGQKYKSQMMLYALAAHELAKVPLACARLYFVRTDQTFDFPLAGMDFSGLRGKFEEMQKEILDRPRQIQHGLKPSPQNS